MHGARFYYKHCMYITSYEYSAIGSRGDRSPCNSLQHVRNIVQQGASPLCAVMQTSPKTFLLQGLIGELSESRPGKGGDLQPKFDP